MAKKVTMTFWRDDYSGPACLEYSWVPEGLCIAAMSLASFGARSYKHNVVIASSPLWETPCGAPPVAHAIPALYEIMGLESGPSETGVLRTRLPVRYWPATGRLLKARDGTEEPSTGIVPGLSRPTQKRR